MRGCLCVRAPEQACLGLLLSILCFIFNLCLQGVLYGASGINLVLTLCLSGFYVFLCVHVFDLGVLYDLDI